MPSATSAKAPEHIVIYGTVWCGDCKRAKKFLGEQRVHFDWVDIEENAEAMAFVEKVNDGKHIVPTILFPDGSTMMEPSNTELAKKLGITTRARMSYYDLIIVGGGPAGLTAAIYAAREGMEVLVMDAGGLGGQAGMTEKLDNFPGFPDGINGAEFADRLVRQARKFDVEILQATKIESAYHEDESCYVRTENGDEYGARAMLIATGSQYKRLEIPGERQLIGAGVHFCATCDGPFYKGKQVVVIGGGNSAGEESLFLTRFASKVTLLVRGPAMRASQVVIEKVMSDPRIEVRLNTSVTELRGEKKLNGVVIRNNQTGQTEEMPIDGMFIFVGQLPNAQWTSDKIAKDDQGFITTDERLMTSVPGVFAAGDVRKGSTKQVASAVGEGATAALMIRESLKKV
jgi:thioredoxin reductase (NADPH)